MSDEKDTGTETGAEDQNAVGADEAAKAAEGTAPDAGKESEDATEEEKAAAAEAAEAAERERKTRENTPGTVEYLEKQVEKEKGKRRKMGITLSKAEERAIRAEEREKVKDELLKQALLSGKPAEKKADADEMPEPPRLSEFENEDQFHEANKKYYKDLSAWNRRQWEKDSAKASETKPKAAEEAPEVARAKRTGEVIGQVAKDFGTEIAQGIIDAAEAKEFFIPEGSAMHQAILESEHAAKVMKHLYETEGESLRIAGLSPIRQVKEIDRIERLVSAAPKPRVPGTPKPVDAVRGGKNEHGGEIKDDEEWYRKEKAKKSSA